MIMTIPWDGNPPFHTLCYSKSRKGYGPPILSILEEVGQGDGYDHDHAQLPGMGIHFHILFLIQKLGREMGMTMTMPLPCLGFPLGRGLW